ncbi:MAG TPA: hypothetical protein DD670_09750 [Planctomycetaceae bacterium]|nr:hypothetical protein [Planctomycetaceae bacterium]
MVRYQVLSIWWPEGWEPSGPADVPNCAWETEFDRIEPPRLGKPLSRDEALALVRALNRQVIDHAADRWYVAAAIDEEPLPRQPGAILTDDRVERYRVHILIPQDASARGDCSHCPAHELDCATADRGSDLTLEVSFRTG